MITTFRLPGCRSFGGSSDVPSSFFETRARAKSVGIRGCRALLLGYVLTVGLAHANGITYTCGGSITTTQCNFLNSTVAGYYSSVFSSATAAIYITTGSISGIGSNYTSYDEITYSQYISDLNGQAASSADTAAHAALSSFDAAIYGSGYVVLPTALAAAIGESINGLPLGVDSTGGTCNLGAAGCYNGDITMSGSASWYFRTGQIGSKYDFYTTAQHETDEVLGTGSCISTVGSLSDWCGSGVPSAADLFRYSSAGHLVANSSLSTTAGAYFSYNGGTSNGASGAVYNSSVNGGDYADFVTNCNGTIYVQDASGCTGKAGVNIGTAETNILDAVGYTLVSSAILPTPEPGSIFLLGGGLFFLVFRHR